MPGGGLRGRRPRRFWAHDDPLGIGGDDQHRGGGARLGDAGCVEGTDVGGSVHDGLLDLPLAEYRPAAVGDRGVRGIEGAAHGFDAAWRARE